MATNSRVSIINLALQMLGAQRISAPDEDSLNATEMNFCYDFIRDYEQRANAWVFTKKRQVLAPSSTVPAFTYAYAFPLPTDCLRILLPSRVVLDWKVESHLGSPAILTNDATSINLRYLGRIEDETKFDPMFTMMFAASLAWQNCEKLTNSNSKQDAIKDRYRAMRIEARRSNAFEQMPENIPVDSWVQAMQTGQLTDASWFDE